MKDYLKLITQVRILREAYGEALQPPATKAKIEFLISNTKKRLSYDVPTEYIDFLYIANGLMWNGFQVYATSIVEIVGKKNHYINGFVETNLHLWESEVNRPFITFGETGDASYVFDKLVGKFAEVDQPSLDVIGTYLTFDALIYRILERSLV